MRLVRERLQHDDQIRLRERPQCLQAGGQSGHVAPRQRRAQLHRQMGGAEENAGAANP